MKPIGPVLPLAAIVWACASLSATAQPAVDPAATHLDAGVLLEAADLFEALDAAAVQSNPRHFAVLLGDLPRRFRYHRTDGEMHVALAGTRATRSRPFDGLILANIEQQTGQYPMTDAFGVQTRQIRQIERKRWNVRPTVPVNFTANPIRTWPVEAAAAEDLSGHLKAAYVIRPVVPEDGVLIMELPGHIAPTWQSAVEMHATYYTLTSDTIALWVIDQRDGRVLQKLDMLEAFTD